MNFRNLKTRTKVLVAGGTAAVVLAGGGAAFAYFTSTGNGSGTASVGSATNWGVSVTSDSTKALYPGVGTETLNYTVTNNGSGHQMLNTLVASVGNSGTNNGCLGSWFTAAVDHGAPNADLAPGGTYTGTITVSMGDANVAQDACQGLTSVPVTLTAG